MRKRARKEVVVKRFLAKKLNGSREEKTVRYDKRKLVQPIYLLRSE